MHYIIREINKENIHLGDKAISQIASTVYSFQDTYSDIKSWFLNKVMPGLHAGERIILYVPGNNKILALAVLKDSTLEKKICTFYISPEARGKGLASLLFEASFTKLKTSTPLISVPESQLSHFKKYLTQYHFHQTNSRVLQDKRFKEFEYNG